MDVTNRPEVVKRICEILICCVESRATEFLKSVKLDHIIIDSSSPYLLMIQEILRNAIHLPMRPSHNAVNSRELKLNNRKMWLVIWFMQLKANAISLRQLNHREMQIFSRQMFRSTGQPELHCLLPKSFPCNSQEDGMSVHWAPSPVLLVCVDAAPGVLAR